MSLGVLNAPPVTSAWDDPLALLPRRKPYYFEKDQTIYTPQDIADSLLLVVEGTVKLSRISPSGRETVLDFCPPDSFFGESCLLGQNYRGELAVALEETCVMEWSRGELEQIMMRTPDLGPALLKVFAEKLQDYGLRVESLAIDQISQRLIKALLRFGKTLGSTSSSGTVHMMPITHELLSKYVGTSREIITQHMSQLRRKGLLRYSRTGIEFKPESLKKLLESG